MEDKQDKRKKQLKNYARFSGLAIQMGVIIGGCVWLGTYLDGKFNKGGQAWTVGLSLFGVAAALYQVLREVINMTKEKDDE